MEIWQIICALVVLVLVAFNPKVQLTKIFAELFVSLWFFFVSRGADSDGLHCRQNGRTRDLYVCL